MANLGVRPTVDGEDLVLEAHLFDFDGDLYGETVSVGLIEYLRDEENFDGIDSLITQMGSDCLSARKILEEL